MVLHSSTEEKQNHQFQSVILILQDLKQTRYRFKIVVVELDAPETPIEYQVALLSFVNCVIISTQGLQDRLRVRNEFIGKFMFNFLFAYMM